MGNLVWFDMTLMNGFGFNLTLLAHPSFVLFDFRIVKGMFRLVIADLLLAEITWGDK